MQIYFYILMTSKKVSIMNFKGKTWTIKNRILDETKSFKQVCKKKIDYENSSDSFIYIIWMI